MGWKNIDTAPKDGTTIKVRDADSPLEYWAKYWTMEELEAEEWDDVAPWWYERHNPEPDDDGDECCNPVMWYDFSED